MTVHHLNRPISIKDSSKAVVGYYNWMPFGGLFNYSGIKGIDLRFPGQVFQAETGLHYNWNRHYDPTTGRYTQPDPLGLVDAPSRFAYVGGDPLQKVDPTGQFAGSLVGPAVSALSWVLRGIGAGALASAILPARPSIIAMPGPKRPFENSLWRVSCSGFRE